MALLKKVAAENLYLSNTMIHDGRWVNFPTTGAHEWGAAVRQTRARGSSCPLAGAAHDGMKLACHMASLDDKLITMS